MADTERRPSPKSPRNRKRLRGRRKATRPNRRRRARNRKRSTRRPRPRPPKRRRKAKKPEERVTPRLKTYFEEVVRKKLSEEFGYKSRLQVPVIEKIVINMGIGEGVTDRKKVEGAANDLSPDCGPEGGDHQSQKVDRHVQGARRAADRLQGDAAQDAHVRVHGSADQYRLAARARLPRLVAEELRRRWQLHDRHQGAHHLSPRSTTTRRPMSGEWMSRFAPARKTTTRRARC